MPYTYDYPRPAAASDVALFADGPDGRPILLLIQRGKAPFKDQWALPGGFMEIDEPLEETARRELREETGIHAPPLRFVGLYDAPGRDPRGRVLSAVYTALLPEAVSCQAGDDAAQARWFPIDALPTLAFDHAQVVADALATLPPRPER